jgi:hypothetical protein
MKARFGKKPSGQLTLGLRSFPPGRKAACAFAALVVVLAGEPTITPAPACAGQAKPHKADMSGMEMDDVDFMRDMGPSMAAMTGHMYITRLRQKQPGDEQRAKTVVATLKSAIERYKDYRKALADGYVIANPKLKQPQYHFMNKKNTYLSDLGFDPTKPTALLYRRTPMLEYRLEGAMYTANPDATEDDLNERIPLSVVRWHRHRNVCWAPEDRLNDYKTAHPKFGMFGSIKTQEACTAEGGTFNATLFTWMIHVFPYETDPKEVFSMNDDVAHVH